MKLIQLNAWGGRLEPQIGDLLRAEKPDILCLQEVISFKEAQGSGLFITTENIQKEFDLLYAAFSPVFTFKYMEGQARFGNGVFSRASIRDYETVFTYGEHTDDFMWSDEIANMRNFVHAILDIDGKSCHVITHHGYWVCENKDGNEETLRQMKILADYIEKLDGPVILTGDFNLAPDSPSLTRLNSLLNNLTITHALPTTRTELTIKTETCDYIFVNNEVTITNFVALDKIVSDHKALLLDFDI